jgi:hypothetical protein
MFPSLPDIHCVNVKQMRWTVICSEAGTLFWVKRPAAAFGAANFVFVERGERGSGTR